MACTPQDITDTELSILEVLWEGGPSTTRQITTRLYPECTASQYATVQSLLSRLEEKRLVRRRRSERVQVFSAAVRREDVIRRRLRALADRLCDGSLSPLLTHLVRGSRLSATERAELRGLLDALERPAGDGRNRA